MHQSLETVCEQLTSLFVQLSESTARSAIDDFYRDFSIERESNLYDLIPNLISKIQHIGIEDLTDIEELKIKLILNRIDDSRRELRYVLSEKVESFIRKTEERIRSIYADIEMLQKSKEQKKESVNSLDELEKLKVLSARLILAETELDRLEPLLKNIKESVDTIYEAKKAATTIPEDVQNLKSAIKDANALYSKASQLNDELDKQYLLSTDAVRFTQARQTEAEALVEQCKELVGIATTAGLAGSFQKRSQSLNLSIVMWVALLAGSLFSSVYLGAMRYETLIKNLVTQHPDWGIISIHLVLSFLALAAPIWFAWLATKQINQRFKLAEDYAFKAAVAKAYEGYRKQAIDIDPNFVARLFSSALNQMEEAPLRLVDRETHGSPWQEFMASKEFKSMLNILPEYKDTIVKTLLERLPTLKVTIPKHKNTLNINDTDKLANGTE